MDLLKSIKLNNKQKAIGVILLFPWYLYFAPIVISFFIALFCKTININVTSDTLTVYYNLLIAFVTAIPLVYLLRNFLFDNWKIFKDNLLENIIWVLTIGIGLTYLCSAGGELVLKLFGHINEASNQVLVERMIKTNFPIMLIQTVIFAPVIEELFFRGIIFNTVYQKNKIAAHLLSAFLFGFLHVYSFILAGDMSQWLNLIPYMAAGLSFSIVYQNRKTIVAPMMLHSLKNLIAVLLTYLLF